MRVLVAKARSSPGRSEGRTRMSYLFFGSLAGTGLLGFLAGLFLFKVKSRWCREHGVVKRCPLCTGQAPASRTAHA
jgi:hypothetical protein